MMSGKPLMITAISFFLLILIGLAVILHYPLNLIVDTSLLAIVGICSIAYLLIWAVQKDKFVICHGHIDIFTRSFPVLIPKKRTVFHSNIRYFYRHRNGASIVLKNGEIIDIENPVDMDGMKVHHIDDTLKGFNIKEVTLEDHLKKSGHQRRSYISKM